MRDESGRPARRSRFGTVRTELTLLATAVVTVMLVVSEIGLVVIQRRLPTGSMPSSSDGR
jgi:hypothetical protein